MSSRGRAPVSRMKAIASMAQSQRLSGSNRATFTNVGRTGEDYAVPFGNAVVMQSDDPRELLATHATLRNRPEVVRTIRADGKATAKRFAWPRVLDGYEAAWETAFALSSS